MLCYPSLAAACVSSPQCLKGALTPRVSPSRPSLKARLTSCATWKEAKSTCSRRVLLSLRLPFRSRTVVSHGSGPDASSGWAPLAPTPLLASLCLAPQACRQMLVE